MTEQAPAGARAGRRHHATIVTFALVAAGLGAVLLGDIDDKRVPSEAFAAVDRTAARLPVVLTTRRDRNLDVFLDRLFSEHVGDPGATGEPAPRRVEAVIQPGDTLARALTTAGADNLDAHNAVTALGELTDLRRLKPGQELVILFDPATDALSEVRLKESVERTVTAHRTDDNGFTADEQLVDFERSVARARGVIDDSLFLAAERAGLETEVLIELIRVFSYDVDFQREIREGDSFEVAYERFLDDDGTVAKTGAIVAATLTLSGRPHTFYHFHPEGEAHADYFGPDGKSVKKTLMRTPIDGARLSSRFGKRRHPILGYTKMHKGLDFAAGSGTPIKAAGDGVVEAAGPNGGYGNYIRIRHNGTYSTAYAHMKGFSRGVRSGARVRQGQIIGYVGTTGRSTGPHLHYEVLKDGQQVNPLSVKLPTGTVLTGNVLENFKQHVAALETTLAGVPYLDQIAEAERRRTAAK